MNMLVKAAVAAAIAAAGATAAQALPIGNYAANSATNVNVFVSGSTALDNTFVNTTILAAAPGGMCQTGTIDIYRITNNVMVYCTSSASSGIAAGLPLAIFKESNGGSANGVGPLINVSKGLSSGLVFLSPAALVAAGGDAACTTTATVGATAALLGYTNHTGCPATAVTAANVAPTGGLADVEASLLRLKDNVKISAADVSNNLQSKGVNDVVWGVVVNKGLYRGLQAAEGLTQDDSPTNAPSLSKAVIASLFQGNVFNWSQITGLTTATDDNVYICRRDIQSGTQASFEAYFMGARCGASSTAFGAQDGFNIIANSSGGNVRSCLTAFENGGTIQPYNGDFAGDAFAPLTVTGGKWAIGILSTEVTSANLTPDTFRMIAVDGVLPTLANAVNGHYPYWSSSVAYQIKAGKPGAPAGNALNVWNTLSTRMGDPAPTAATNSAYVGRPWGDGGDLAPASQFVTSATTVTMPATTASVRTNPINAFTKASSGSVNNCDTPVLLQGAGGSFLQKMPSQNRLLGTGNVNN